MLTDPVSPGTAAEQSPAARQLMDKGYTILRGAAPASLIEGIGFDLDPRYGATPFCEGGFYGTRTKRFGRLLIRSPLAADLVMNSAILDLAELALGNWCERIQLNLAQAIELHPGALAQFPHRDQDMWQGALGEVEYLVKSRFSHLAPCASSPMRHRTYPIGVALQLVSNETGPIWGQPCGLARRRLVLRRGCAVAGGWGARLAAPPNLPSTLGSPGETRWVHYMRTEYRRATSAARSPRRSCTIFALTASGFRAFPRSM